MSVPAPGSGASLTLTAKFRTTEGAWKLAAGGVVLFFLICAVLYSIITPLGAGQDEYSHLGYVLIVAQHLALPGHGVYERQQPPLYYLLAAILYKLSGSTFVVRLLSPLFGAATLIVCMRTARLIFPRRPWLAVLSALLIAIIPQFQWVDATITDDPLSYLVAALIALQTVRLILDPAYERPSTRVAVRIGLLAGVALLSKETTWVLLAFLYGVGAVRWKLHMRFKQWAALVGIPAVLAGWWYVRNLMLFHSLIPSLTPINNPGHILLHLNSYSDVHGWITITFKSFFGYFGPRPTPLQLLGQSTNIFRALELLVVVIVVACVIMTMNRWTRLSARQKAVIYTFVAMLALSLLASVVNSMKVDFQPQGRYLYVAITGIAIATAWTVVGLLRPLPVPLRSALVAVACICAIALDIGGLATMAGPGRTALALPTTASAYSAGSIAEVGSYLPTPVQPIAT